MKTGTVKKFDETRGFGFISSNDNIDYFVHLNDIQGDNTQPLKVGYTVNFTPIKTPKGWAAKNVRPQ